MELNLAGSGSQARRRIHDSRPAASDPELCKHLDEALAAFYAALMEESLTLFVHGDQPRALTIVEQDINNVRSAWRSD